MLATLTVSGSNEQQTIWMLLNPRWMRLSGQAHNISNSRNGTAYTPIPVRPRTPIHIQMLTSLAVLHYFSWSPFFDHTSNNNALIVQAGASQELFDAFWNRQLFEARLRTMQGLEFIVIEDPSEGGTKLEHSGVWVIRKQYRKKIAGAQDDITPVCCYTVMGENIFIAPTIGDILSGRLVKP